MVSATAEPGWDDSRYRWRVAQCYTPRVPCPHRFNGSDLDPSKGGARASLPDPHAVDKLKWVVFDLDGTLTRSSTMAFIAASVGDGARAQQLSADYRSGRSTNAEVSAAYAEVLRTAHLAEDALQEVLARIDVLDGIADVVQKLHYWGLRCAISTITFDFIAEYFLERFGFDHYWASTLKRDANGRLTGHVEVARESIDKLRDLRYFCTQRDIDIAQTAFVGDGRSDIAVMRHVGLSIALNADDHVSSIACLDIKADDLNSILSPIHPFQCGDRRDRACTHVVSQPWLEQADGKKRRELEPTSTPIENTTLFEADRRATDVQHTTYRCDSELFAAEAIHVTRHHGRFTVLATAADVHPAVADGLIVLVRGDVRHGENVLCRVSSACVTSTALDSAECDCSQQLDASLATIDREDRGVLIYLTDQEGRGQGLVAKVRALAHKNGGLDTFAAVEAIGLEADVRRFDAIGPILRALEVRSITLLASNPEKRDAISRCGVEVTDMRPLRVEPPSWAQPSMRAKRDRGHVLTGRYVDDPQMPYP